jgi:hypothetical protein
LDIFQEAYDIDGKQQVAKVKKQYRKSLQISKQKKKYIMRRKSLNTIKVPYKLKSMVRTKYIEDFVIIGQDQEMNFEKYMVDL